MYLPYPGFFNKIKEADIFVIGDDALYSRRAFYNRNKIKGPNGPVMITVPLIDAEGKKLNEVEIFNGIDWKKKHLKSIETFYQKADYYENYIDFFRKIYKKKWEKLFGINMETTYYIMEQIGLDKEIFFTSELLRDYEFKGKTQRIVDICKILGADEYFSGIGGKNYLEPELFEKNKISLQYQNYYPKVYKQLYGRFIPNLSIVDLLFNKGEEAIEYI